jgi:hypothetical protein
MIFIIFRPEKLALEIYGLSDLIRKILLFNRAALLSLVSSQVLEDFFKAIGSFSCQVIQQSAIEESKCGVDDRIYRESLTRGIRLKKTIHMTMKPYDHLYMNIYLSSCFQLWKLG